MIEPGPATGFADEVAALVPDLVRFARSLTRDHAAADDLAQEAVLRALSNQHQFRRDSSLRTWLHRILHNLAVDRGRRSARETVVDEIEASWRDDDYSVDAHEVIEQAQLRESMEDALVHLPVIYRAAVVLHDAEGWTVKEIAELQQIGLPAAKQRLRRGRMMLVSELARAAERRGQTKGVPLRCWDARRFVSDYLDGELARDEAALVERHLETCPTCPPLYAALVGVRSELGSRDPDSVIEPAVVARLERVARSQT
jgi:RNA polymerase sigma-70 factor (ECF subfamily)